MAELENTALKVVAECEKLGVDKEQLKDREPVQRKPLTVINASLASSQMEGTGMHTTAHALLLSNIVTREE